MLWNPRQLSIMLNWWELSLEKLLSRLGRVSELFIETSTPTSATSSCQPVQQSLITSTPSNSPPPKRQRMCGRCGQTGHNIRTSAGLAKDFT